MVNRSKSTMIQRANAAAGPLHTQGRQILNASNSEVGFSGLNWFGFETENYSPHGLWMRNWKDILDQVKELGYNSLRIPFSNAMLQDGRLPAGIDYSMNPDLKGLTSLEVLDTIIQGAAERGLWVILDNHRSSPGGGPEAGGLWYTAQFPESRWISDWEMLADRYKGNPAVIAVDLRNEPYGGCWGCSNPSTDWRLAAEKAGNAILAINPDLLIIVEGVSVYDGQSTWWGGNLMGVRDHPVRLNLPGRLIYSTHEYPQSVSYQPWFDDPTYPKNLPAVWDKYWGYIIKENLAPVLIGEFGTLYQTEKDQQWLQTLISYIQQEKLSWTFWSLNPNSEDTGGLLLNDWLSVQTEKHSLLKEIQYLFEGDDVPNKLPPTSPQPGPTLQDSIYLPLITGAFGGTISGGWQTFHDPLSFIQTEPVLSGRGVKVQYEIIPGGWAGVEQRFNLPQDWSKKESFTFRIAGQNTGNRIRVEILENRIPGDLADTSERFEVLLDDDFTGWKDFSLPWSAFQRRGDWQPEDAPQDGFDRREVWGFSFSPLEGSGLFWIEKY